MRCVLAAGGSTAVSSQRAWGCVGALPHMQQLSSVDQWSVVGMHKHRHRTSVVASSFTAGRGCMGVPVSFKWIQK